jgi:murein DD-endopeptidase / murein LD-carboxypeptidase
MKDDLACFLYLRLCGANFASQQKINPMKNLILIASILLILSSCSSTRNSIKGKSSDNTVLMQQQKSQFIEGIEVKQNDVYLAAQEQPQIANHEEIKPVTVPVTVKSEPGDNSAAFETKPTATFVSSLESFSITQLKYAIRLNVPVEYLQNKLLYETISNWWATPYRMGGTTRKGIDCSAFVQTLMLGVFSIQLPRTARDQIKVTSRISAKNLKEGDLVFFNTRGGVSHVGVYLQNNKFVHASSSKGVMISDLTEAYWSKKIIGGGRVLPLNDLTK